MTDELIPAAQYVRMSTEHQQYSTENQADVIREYAAKRGLAIVRTFSDAGKSGPKADCLAYIKEVWTDMRPLSLRKRMAENK